MRLPSNRLLTHQVEALLRQFLQAGGLEELLPEGVDPLAKMPGRGAPNRSGSRLGKEYTCPIRARTPISSYPDRTPLFAKT